MFSINARRDRLKRRWRGKPFTNGNLDIGLQLVGGFGIAKLRFDIVDRLFKLHPKKRRRLKPKLS